MRRPPVVLAAVLVLGAFIGAPSESAAGADPRDTAIYLVRVSDAPSVVGGASVRATRSSQEPALAAARSLGGTVGYRYSRSVNGFSVRLTPSAARTLRSAPGVVAVEPAPIVRAALTESVEAIGTKTAWEDHKVKGRGVQVAVIDSGIDYTHAAFGGPGTSAAYRSNDPDVREPGSFPTDKVIKGWDFVGDDYDVLDNKTANDIPKPDPDPLDPQGHGTHVGHTCCGKRVSGLGKGVAPQVKIHAYKVWGNGGSSTADVLVAAYERALDPNQDGDLSDRVDVVNFSGGVYYGTPTSTESVAAQSLVEAGIVFVAAAGNSGGHAYRVGTPATAPGVVSVAATELGTDRIAGFSSPGPARGGHGFKPEVAAPGVGIHAAAAGSGSGGVFLSGTSMASPHVAGAAALLVDKRPGWGPALIKSALINHAQRAIKARGTAPGPATLTGAGLVRVDHSIRARSLAVPSSVAFGAVHAPLGHQVDGAPFEVINRDRRGHRYVIRSEHHYSSVEPATASVSLSIDGDPFSEKVSFWLKPRTSKVVTPRLLLEPGLLSDASEAMPRYGDLPQIDGSLLVKQRRFKRDTFRLPWLVVPYATARVSAMDQTVDLSGGSATLGLDVEPSAGTPAADAYLLGAVDPLSDVELAEADIRFAGARSFAGVALGDGPEGLPEELDPVESEEWLSAIGAPGLEEPVEVGVALAAPHETIETLRVRVYVDAGADGVFADDAAGADYVVEKFPLSDRGCVFPAPRQGASCVGSAGVDYDRFDSDLVGLVFDAFDIGLSEGDSAFSYRVEACSDTFSGDVEDLRCDSTAGIGSGDTYPAVLDVTDQSPLPASPFCGGFWSLIDCRDGFELSGAPSDPDVLLIFPNDAPGSSAEVVGTD